MNVGVFASTTYVAIYKTKSDVETRRDKTNT